MNQISTDQEFIGFENNTVCKKLKLSIINKKTGHQLPDNKPKENKYNKYDNCSEALSTGKHKKQIKKCTLFSRTPVNTRGRAKQKLGKDKQLDIPLYWRRKV